MSDLLDTSLTVGRRLAAEAFWDDGCCSWIGTVPVAAPPGKRAPLTAAAIGPDLYGGTAGVGLFLAHLAGQTGEIEIRRTALGALRHALTWAERLPPVRALGLYDGRLGVALAAARSGAILDAPRLRAAGAALGARAASGPDPAAGDMIGGTAGAVAGLLSLSDELAEPGFRERAIQMGPALARAAGSPSLTGMAHGAAGQVHALLELVVVSGDDRLRAAAEEAVAYERRLFDPPTGNWPDLRDDGHGPAGSASGIAWCHGAPGILLSRRCASEVLGPDEDDELRSGFATTERWVRSALATRPGNFSLCHGLAGNAEVLWETAGGLGQDPGSARRLAHDVAAMGTEEHARTGDAWPCGTPGGETPSLMLGLAGIGLFYLRLHDPSIPSVLAPVPASRGLSVGASP